MAKAIGGEVINADSMQVYKRIPIITNKHPIVEREGVPHHIIDYVDWSVNYSISRFAKDAQAAIDDIHSRGKIPIVVGGTHYYLHELLFENKTVGHATRELTPQEKEILDGPVEKICGELAQVDPVILGKFHPRNKRKLRTALMVYYTTGRRPSDIYHEQKVNESSALSLKYNTVFFWPFCDREVLLPRLYERVETMMALGAVDEIHEMDTAYRAEEPVDITRGVWQVIGFKEFLPWLDGGCLDQQLFKDGVEKMKIRTRQYANDQVKTARKLLGVELVKEARFNYRHGGKMYILDATDLTQWDAECARGVDIAKHFIKEGPNAVTHAEAPPRLEHLLPTAKSFSTANSDKLLGLESNWKHFECDVCKDGDGNILVVVGKQQWDIHVKSRRHRKQHKYLDRKRAHEEHVAKNKKMRESADEAEE